MLLEGSEGQDRFTCHIGGVGAFDVKGNIIDPSLQLNRRMILDQGTQRLVKHELGDGRSLRAALKYALLIMKGLS